MSVFIHNPYDVPKSHSGSSVDGLEPRTPTQPSTEATWTTSISMNVTEFRHTNYATEICFPNTHTNTSSSSLKATSLNSKFDPTHLQTSSSPPSALPHPHYAMDTQHSTRPSGVQPSWLCGGQVVYRPFGQNASPVPCATTTVDPSIHSSEVLLQQQQLRLLQYHHQQQLEHFQQIQHYQHNNNSSTDWHNLDGTRLAQHSMVPHPHSRPFAAPQPPQAVPFDSTSADHFDGPPMNCVESLGERQQQQQQHPTMWRQKINDDFNNGSPHTQHSQHGASGIPFPTYHHMKYVDPQFDGTHGGDEDFPLLIRLSRMSHFKQKQFLSGKLRQALCELCGMAGEDALHVCGMMLNASVNNLVRVLENPEELSGHAMACLQCIRREQLRSMEQQQQKQPQPQPCTAESTRHGEEDTNAGDLCEDHTTPPINCTKGKDARVVRLTSVQQVSPFTSVAAPCPVPVAPIHIAAPAATAGAAKADKMRPHKRCEGMGNEGVPCKDASMCHNEENSESVSNANPPTMTRNEKPSYRGGDDASDGCAAVEAKQNQKINEKQPQRSQHNNVKSAQTKSSPETKPSASNEKNDEQNDPQRNADNRTDESGRDVKTENYWRKPHHYGNHNDHNDHNGNLYHNSNGNGNANPTHVHMHYYDRGQHYSNTNGGYCGSRGSHWRGRSFGGRGYSDRRWGYDEYRGYGGNGRRYCNGNGDVHTHHSFDNHRRYHTRTHRDDTTGEGRSGSNCTKN